jgi:hypothetical protein
MWKKIHDVFVCFRRRRQAVTFGTGADKRKVQSRFEKKKTGASKGQSKRKWNLKVSMTLPCFVNTGLLRPELNYYLEHIPISTQINPGSMVNYISLELKQQLGKWLPIGSGVSDGLSKYERPVEKTDKILYLQDLGKLEVLGTITI